MEKELNHPEWEKENSLTSPLDRDRENKWRPDQSGVVLSEEEVAEAMRELNVDSFVSKFPRVDRTFADPPPPLQSIGLISFVPARGATPDANGIYGFAKLRGNYSSEIEARQRAEFLIRHVDSYHRIYHAYVGRPFPLTVNPNYAAETEEIDIRSEIAKSISEDVQKKRMDEKREIEGMKEKEKKLLEDSKKVQADPVAKVTDDFDDYVTLRVKKAQLSWTYLEHQKKMKEVRDALIRTREDIASMDSKYPDYSTGYYEKYKRAREEAGIKDDTAEETHNNFMKYMVEDAELDF